VLWSALLAHGEAFLSCFSFSTPLIGNGGFEADLSFIRVFPEFSQTAIKLNQIGRMDGRTDGWMDGANNMI